jgi:FSR family fosmidomycin resistance protein-like MFS transporter
MTVDTMTATQVAEPEEFQTDRVVTISAGHAVHDTYTAFLPPLLPAFIETMSLSTTQAGLLSVFLTAPSLVQPFIGHLADRFSLRYFVILAPAVTAVAMSLLGMAPGYAALVLLLVVAGLSSASLHAVGPVMAGRLSGQSLGRGMGFWMVGGELGRTLGPIIIVTAVALLTLQGMSLLMVVGLLASAILYFRLRDVPGRPATARPSLPWQPALWSMRGLLVPLVGLILVRAFIIASLTTYLPIFLTEEGANFWFAGASLSVLEAAGVVGALAGGTVSDWLGRKQVLLISLVTTTLFMFIFLAVDGWAQFPALLVLGLTALSVTPVLMAVVQESVPDNRALANGMYMALSFCIRAGVVVVVGMLGDMSGLRLAFTVSAIMPVLGVPFVLMLPGRGRMEEHPPSLP